MHFGYYLDEPILHRYHLHIPLRHPHAVAESWARRGKNPDALIRAYESMFNHTDHCTVHIMEELPRLDGGDDWDRNVRGDTLVAQYVERIDREVVTPHRDWFGNYYDIHLEM